MKTGRITDTEIRMAIWYWISETKRKCRPGPAAIEFQRPARMSDGSVIVNAESKHIRIGRDIVDGTARVFADMGYAR